MLRRGVLHGFDVGCRRAQIRIPPESIKEAEQRLAVRPQIHKRKKRSEIDADIEKMLLG